MDQLKTAFVSFFSIIPDTNGSAAMTNNRFKNWPNKKKLFQLSHFRKKKYKKSLFSFYLQGITTKQNFQTSRNYF